MISITASDAARGFTDLMHRVVKGREDAIVTEKGIPVVKVVALMDKTHTGKELARKWAQLRHLDAAEAESFEVDLRKANSHLLPPQSKWD